MAEKDKKYYWLKLKRDFFKRHDIQIIESMPNGKDYILFYLKLLCESVDHEGNLRFSDEIPYNEQMLSTITNTNVDIVRSAIKIFSQLHMMEIMDDGTYFMSQVEGMIASETYWAKKKREQRENEKLTAENGKIGQIPTLSNDCPTCPSKSKSIEKEIDKEIDIKTFCPEPDKSGSGPQPTTERPTVDNGVKEIDTAADTGAKGIGTSAGMMVGKAAGPSPEVFIQLPLNTGELFDVTVDYVAEKQALYPAVDVKQQLRAMKGWLADNPKNRKTKSGIRRFINGWLDREQDKAPRADKKQQPARTTNSFNNFQQRDYDWDEIEQKLIEASQREMQRKRDTV